MHLELSIKAYVDLTKFHLSGSRRELDTGFRDLFEAGETYGQFENAIVVC